MGIIRARVDLECFDKLNSLLTEHSIETEVNFSITDVKIREPRYGVTRLTSTTMTWAQLLTDCIYP